MQLKKNGFWYRLRKDLVRNKTLYFMLIPVVAHVLLFQYFPMYGAQIAFRDYIPKKGMWGSQWIGLKNFKDFFDSVYFGRLIKNTFLISALELLFAFPAPIVLALMLNEVRNMKFKKVVQTISYLPHFISLVVAMGIVRSFVSSDGLITTFLTLFGYPQQNLLIDPSMYRPIYIISGIWQGVGFGSIIYLAALAGISAELYDAASIDGAGRWKQMIHVTLPGLAPTIVLMLILKMGSLMSVGYDKTLLLYNSAIYETADIISSYVYRRGIIDQSYGFSTAVGLFNTAINLVLLVTSNKVSKKITGLGMW